MNEDENLNVLKVGSVFCGCGGLDYAFHESKDTNVIFANDNDIDACKTYKQNYNFSPINTDIKALENIPDIDLLLGGFPCQGFSVANKNRNEFDKRNELYKELIRILYLKNPKYFIFENVKGILNIGGYETPIDKKNKTGIIFKKIIEDFKNCGYNIYTKLFKMKWYDIPQNRESVIFIGIRNDINNNIKFEWPIETKTIRKTLYDAINDLSKEFKDENQHIGTSHSVKINGYIGNRQLKWNEISPTITGRGSGGGGPVINIHPDNKRRMSVREYARIQTFPDDFVFYGSISSMYRQIGNAVPPRFSFILLEIINNMEKQINSSKSN